MVVTGYLCCVDGQNNISHYGGIVIISNLDESVTFMPTRYYAVEHNSYIKIVPFLLYHRKANHILK